MPSTERLDQHREIKRVRGNIAMVIIDFLLERLNAQLGAFTMSELEDHVKAKTATTPGSAGRILRDLNRAGRITYYCQDRAKASYVVSEVVK